MTMVTIARASAHSPETFSLRTCVSAPSGITTPKLARYFLESRSAAYSASGSSIRFCAASWKGFVAKTFSSRRIAPTTLTGLGAFVITISSH